MKNDKVGFCFDVRLPWAEEDVVVLEVLVEVVVNIPRRDPAEVDLEALKTLDSRETGVVTVVTVDLGLEAAVWTKEEEDTGKHQYICVAVCLYVLLVDKYIYKHQYICVHVCLYVLLVDRYIII